MHTPRHATHPQTCVYLSIATSLLRFALFCSTLLRFARPRSDRINEMCFVHAANVNANTQNNRALN